MAALALPWAGHEQRGLRSLLSRAIEVGNCREGSSLGSSVSLTSA